MSETAETTMQANQTTVQYEVWFTEPDGSEHLAYFLNSPERHDDPERADRAAERYNRETKNWGLKPRVFFVVTATSLTTRERKET